jgi:hypothetical protein
MNVALIDTDFDEKESFLWANGHEIGVLVDRTTTWHRVHFGCS